MTLQEQRKLLQDLGYTTFTSRKAVNYKHWKKSKEIQEGWYECFY